MTNAVHALLLAGTVAASVVHLDAGAIRGIAGVTTTSYLGIPFAAPPVGAARWQPPRAVPPWSGVRDATRLAEPCASQGFGDSRRSTAQDCLYLNVYAPRGAKPGAGLPVMVFIHGGGNVMGSTTIYDGMRMAEITHAIVVMPAYRLGVFGALALPSFGANGGTFIIQDNIAALRWVRRNIAAFGGDPHDVTVSGESSGGTDVCNLLVSPAAAGLFHQAIVQSGLCGGSGTFGYQTLAVAQGEATAFATSVGCTQPDPAPCLRAKPAGELIDAWKGKSNPPYGTPLLPVLPETAFTSGRFNRVPVLFGFTHDEWWWVEDALYPLSAAGLQQQFVKNFGTRAPVIAARYPEARYPHREDALGAAVGDSLIICPSLRLATLLAAHVPVSVYEFDDATVPHFKSLDPAHPSSRPPGYTDGVAHTSELQYLYAYQAADGPLDATQKRLADAMIVRWVGFGRAASAWPEFSAQHPVVVRIGADGSSFTPSTGVAADHRCDAWETRGL